MNEKGIVRYARLFAIKAHGLQKYSEHDYVYHLDAVNAVLRRFGVHEIKEGVEYETVGYLHDVVEDTKIKGTTICTAFGQNVGNATMAISNEDGQNRKERKAKTYKKIVKNKYALVVKLADRIANTEESLKNNNRLYNMYKKEYKVFKDNLNIKTDDIEANKILENMWGHLDSLVKEKV